MNSLLEKCAFTLVGKLKAVGRQIYGPRFCDHIKHAGTTSAQAKLRKVIQAFHDKLHGLLNHAPTVQRLS